MLNLGLTASLLNLRERLNLKLTCIWRIMLVEDVFPQTKIWNSWLWFIFPLHQFFLLFGRLPLDTMKSVYFMQIINIYIHASSGKALTPTLTWPQSGLKCLLHPARQSSINWCESKFCPHFLWFMHIIYTIPPQTHAHWHTHVCTLLKSPYPLCALWPLIQHMDPLGFGSAVLSATEGPLKISPLFPMVSPLVQGEKGESKSARERERKREVVREKETEMAF